RSVSAAAHDKFIKRLQRAVFPGVVSNHHLHAMAALGITLAEFVEFGREYAAQIVRNSKALAQALHERSIKVLAEKHGFTESHTVALDVAALGVGAMRTEFNTVHYCFTEGAEAHRRWRIA